MDGNSAIVRRAAAVLEAARFGQLSPATAREYLAVSDRLVAAWDREDDAWGGACAEDVSPRTAAVRRAAWTRRAHREVAAALRDAIAGGTAAVGATGRLLRWVPEAEAFPPSPPRDLSGLSRGRAPSAPPQPTSKRTGIRSLPHDWLDVLWEEALAERFGHLDGLALLVATGCRPAEACRGVGVRRVEGGVQCVVRGAKVREDAGQPWRLLTVADGGGATGRLGGLADAAGGRALVRPACTPAALSMGIAALAAGCLPGRRLSAYDVRHQRASDARAAFGDDLASVAAWMGHAGTGTLRYYGRLPRSSGSRGPLPLAATAARPVTHAVPFPGHSPETHAAQ